MRTIQGTVISTKMDKTIVVAVVTEKSHPKYHKKYKVTKKFYAHDEKGTCVEGDVVTIVESIPLSKLKRWRLESDVTTVKDASAKKAAVKKEITDSKTETKKPAVKKAPAKKPVAKKEVK